MVKYNEATDGGQVSEPQRQVWIDQQRNLDGSLRLFVEGCYSLAEFLICARHSTPTFGVIQPQHQAIPIHAAVFSQAPQQEAPALAPLPIDQDQELIREEIMRRILPRRPAVPIPRDRMIFHYSISYTDFQKNILKNKFLVFSF